MKIIEYAVNVDRGERVFPRAFFVELERIGERALCRRLPNGANYPGGSLIVLPPGKAV